MRTFSIAIFAIAATQAVKLTYDPDFSMEDFVVHNIVATFSPDLATAQVYFEAPRTTLSAVENYTVNFKGPSVDTELLCTASPCELDSVDIGDLQGDQDYKILVKPNYTKKFTVPFPFQPGQTRYGCDDEKAAATRQQLIDHSFNSCWEVKEFEELALHSGCVVDVNDYLDVNDKTMLDWYISCAYESIKIEVVNSLVHMNSDLTHVEKYLGTNTIMTAISYEQSTDVLQLLVDNTPDYESFLNTKATLYDSNSKPGYMKLRNEGVNYLEFSCLKGNQAGVQLFTELGFELAPGLDCDELYKDYRRDHDFSRHINDRWFNL